MNRFSRVSADRLSLALILLIALSLRLAYLQTPLFDNHRWRQTETASMARILYEDGLNPFYPQVAWGGAHGYVECEFPLLPFVTALLYTVFGELEWLGRVVAIAFSMGTILLAYRLGCLLIGDAAGRGFAFLLAVSPGAVFYGRTVMPEPVMLFFSTAAVLGFVAYFQSGGRVALAVGSASLAMAGLAKLPALLVLGPILAAAWHARGWRAWRDVRALIGISLALVAVAAWYGHAYSLFQQTGLTFGIFSQPAGTYPPAIGIGTGPNQFSKWSTLALLSDPAFYRTILTRLNSLYLLPWGLAGALLGLLAWPRDRWPGVGAAWAAAVVAFILVAGGGNRAHDYYQLPVVLPGGLLFGAAAAPLFGGGWLRAGHGWRLPGAVVVTLILLIGGILSFQASGVLDTHYRTRRPDVRSVQVGRAVAASVDRRALAIVVDDYGTTSPVLLHFARMRGWSFSVTDLSPQLIESLARRHGARYFVTSAWPQVQQARPDVADLLRDGTAVAVRNAPRGVRIYQLDQF